MDKKELQLLKRHFDFEEWAGKTTMRENTFIWRFFLSGDEFPGWQADRIESVQREDVPSCLLALLQRPEGGPDELLRLDVFEWGSLMAAHEFVVQILAEFQTTEVVRRMDLEIGDVAFADPTENTNLFARSNLAVLIRNAGHQDMPVTEVARLLDDAFTIRPAIEMTDVVPTISRFARTGAEPRLGEPAVLEIEAVDPLQRPLWFKFYTNKGEVILKEDRVAYQPTIAGSQDVEVFAINANRGAAYQKLELFVK